MAFLFKTKQQRSFTEASSTKSKSMKNFIAKAAGLITGDSGRDGQPGGEYNLEEIKLASEKDSYIKMALMKYSYMLFKAGYRLESENQDAIDYIKSRFYIMSFATNKPTDILLQELGDDLIKYSNAFVVKSRVAQVMSGINAKGAFDATQPIGGYYRIDPSTVTIDRDKFGTIKSYKQTVDGEDKNFKASEVIHFYLDKDAANAFGTPRIVSALEDVKLLRKIEGNIATMIYKYSMPLYQWIIGLPQQGFQATDNEISEAKDAIDNMPLDGSIVTNEKTTIKSIGAEGSALSAEGYLSYFEKRVFTALGVSESQMGRGGAKQDADSMESQAHDTVKHIQKVYATFLEYLIINELLLEGGFDPITNPDDRVQFIFNEINIDTKIKVENHEMAKFQSNILSMKEVRKKLGYSEDVDDSDLYQNRIIVNAESELAKVKADESIRVAQESAKLNMNSANSTTGSTGTKGINVSGNGNEKSQEPNNDVTNKNTPENQYGTTSVKVKEGLSIQEKAKSKKVHKKTFSNIYNKYEIISNDIKENPEEIKHISKMGVTTLLSLTMQEMQVRSLDGIRDASNQIRSKSDKALLLPKVNISFEPFEKMCKESLEKLFKEANDRIKDNKDPRFIENVYSSLDYRIRFMLEYVLPKVYWYSYLRTGEEYKVKEAEVLFNGSDDEKEHSKIINLKNIDLDDIPPFHPFCDCKVKFKIKKGGR